MVPLIFGCTDSLLDTLGSKIRGDKAGLDIIRAEAWFKGIIYFASCEILDGTGVTVCCSRGDNFDEGGRIEP